MPSIYMDNDGRIKDTTHFSLICGSSNWNPQVLLYDRHYNHFDDREIKIILSHHIQPFILKSDYYINYVTNYNGPNSRLMTLYSNIIINWMSNHVTLKFMPAHMNSVLVETWR